MLCILLFAPGIFMYFFNAATRALIFRPTFPGSHRTSRLLWQSHQVHAKLDRQRVRSLWHSCAGFLTVTEFRPRLYDCTSLLLWLGTELRNSGIQNKGSRMVRDTEVSN